MLETPPYPRNLFVRAIKVPLVALWVILGAVWLTAPWWYTDFEVSGVDVGFIRGGIRILWQNGSMNHHPGGWRVETWSQWVWWQWWFAYESSSIRQYSHGTLFIPLWFPALLLGGLWYVLGRLERRAALGRICQKCHYDRTGLAAGAVCPECGAAPTA
jgi:hypothetical protein